VISRGLPNPTRIPQPPSKRVTTAACSSTRTFGPRKAGVLPLGRPMIQPRAARAIPNAGSTAYLRAVRRLSVAAVGPWFCAARSVSRTGSARCVAGRLGLLGATARFGPLGGLR
jgi:hypothetical protein